MSETGERDGKKPTHQGEPAKSASVRPPPGSFHPPSVQDDEEFAGWDDTTQVRDTSELILATALKEERTNHGPYGAVERFERDERQAALLPPPTSSPPQPTLPRPDPTPPSITGPVPISMAPARVIPRLAMQLTRPGTVEMGRPVFAVGFVGLLSAASAWILVGGSSALGVLVGSAFATANLWAFTRIGKGLVGDRAAAWGLLATAKLILLFGAAFAVLTLRVAAPLPFLIGYLALPVGIVLSQLLGLKSEFEDHEGSI